MIKLTDILENITSENDERKYYIDLIPRSDYKKYQQVEKTINKLKKLGANASNLDTDKIYGDKVKQFFVGVLKDGTLIPAQYTKKNDLFNHPMGDIKVKLFTKEEAEKYKDMMDNYSKDSSGNLMWIVTIKMI